MADGPDHILLGKEWHRCAFDPRKILEEVVCRRELARCRVAQYSVEPAFGLAGEHGNSHVSASSEVDSMTVQHRQTSGDMESAHHDWNPDLAKRSCNVEGARILV